ncbi:MAG: enoyl-CoA hydratase/isomerase family protein [Hyphomicrobiales bacterium]
MSLKTIKVDYFHNYVVISLDRPKVLNALSSTVFKELEEVLLDLEVQAEIRLAIITGSGKAFAAGADIEEMVNKSPDEAHEYATYAQRVLNVIENIRFPVIAAINGYALGGGLELALACDFRICTESAKFGQPEVNLGLIPGFAATQRLPRLIGQGNALFMLLSGENIDAITARRFGIVQKIYADNEFNDSVHAIAKAILSKGPKAIELIKVTVRKESETSFEEACRMETTHFSSLFGDDTEGREGMYAFLQKRKPNWNL